MSQHVLIMMIGIYLWSDAYVLAPYTPSSTVTRIQLQATSTLCMYDVCMFSVALYFNSEPIRNVADYPLPKDRRYAAESNRTMKALLLTTSCTVSQDISLTTLLYSEQNHQRPSISQYVSKTPEDMAVSSSSSIFCR